MRTWTTRESANIVRLCWAGDECGRGADCIEHGWAYDADEEMLQPKKETEPPREFTGMEQLKSLTDYVTFLEKSRLT